MEAICIEHDEEAGTEAATKQTIEEAIKCELEAILHLKHRCIPREQVRLEAQVHLYALTELVDLLLKP